MARQYGSRRYQPRRGDYRSSDTMQWLGPLIGVVLALLILLALGFVAFKGLTRSDFFQITEIDIEGCKRVSKEKVLEWSGVDIHSNLAALAVKEVKARVESQGWVEVA
ncbi:MAG TPA: FtsQ-type POTRA domain-containing protein, partial [Desulfurivibrionaceae bacterium]|nr:FtsQ-type POTRA domain-containing protein [Desulfurivibrionaceae bacterium]